MSNNSTVLSPTIAMTKDKEAAKILTSALLLIIIVAALVGNLIVILAFVVSRSLRQGVTNYFIVSLAVSDFLSAALVMTFDLDIALNNSVWNHGQVMCDMYTTMYLLTAPSSVINLCAVTVYRYLVLSMPLRYNTLVPPRRAVRIILSLWLYALILACLPVMGWRNQHRAIFRDGQCFFVISTAYNILINVCNFLLPLVFMGFFWWRIYGIARKQAKKDQTLRKSISLNTDNSSREHASDGNESLRRESAGSCRRQQKRIQRRLKGSKYIAVVVAVFYVCWLPFTLVSMAGALCKECYHKGLIPPLLIDFLLLMGYLNSALNPFLYPLHDKVFRRAFKDMWRTVKRGKYWEMLKRQ